MAKGLLVGAESKILPTANITSTNVTVVTTKDTYVTAISAESTIDTGVWIIVYNGDDEVIGYVFLNAVGNGTLSFSAPLYAKGGLKVKGSVSMIAKVHVHVVKPS